MFCSSVVLCDIEYLAIIEWLKEGSSLNKKEKKKKGQKNKDSSSF